MYSKYANEQKFYKLDLKSVNEYISGIFGKNQPQDPHAGNAKGMPTMIECKNEFDDKVNNIYNIRDARNSLRRKTGKKEFNMNEIIREIELMSPSKKYKLTGVDYNNGVKEGTNAV